MNKFSRRGFMLIISSPSGGGKTTIIKNIMNVVDGLKLSISTTTRAPRPGEEDGKDYFFMNDDEFKKVRSENYFLEHAKVFGRYYGTPKNYVEAQLESGYDVVFDIDWQGTIQLSQNVRNDVVSIFVLPPSIELLEERLQGRGDCEREEVEFRMKRAKYEISHWYGYDYVFVNNDLSDSIELVKSIIIAERHKRVRQQHLPEFIENMFTS